MPTVEDLVRLVAPPAVPVAADGDWLAVARSLGVDLPDDYKDLVRTYGLGSFEDITLWTPFAEPVRGGSNLVVQALDLVELHRPFREMAPEEFIHPLFPEPGGLLEWASTGDADSLCWLTVGEPNEWPTVVWNLRVGASRFEMGAVDLLYAYLSGQQEVP